MTSYHVVKVTDGTFGSNGRDTKSNGRDVILKIEQICYFCKSSFRNMNLFDRDNKVIKFDSKHIIIYIQMIQT